MHVLFLSLLVSAPAFPSGTNVNHYDLDRTSCRAAKKLVDDKGAVVFQWDHNRNQLYTRVVKDQGFCMMGEEAIPFGDVNAVTRGCFPGFYCETRQRDGGGSGGN